jgi:hypothetical protein
MSPPVYPVRSLPHALHLCGSRNAANRMISDPDSDRAFDNQNRQGGRTPQVTASAED